MKCEERRDLLLLYVTDTDALDSAEVAELRAHLASGCVACAAALAEAHATVAHLAALAPAAEPPAVAKDKLLARIASDRLHAAGQRAALEQPATTLQSTSPRRGRVLTTTLIAASVGLLLGLGLMYNWVGDRGGPPRLAADPNVALVAMQANDPATSKARGRIFWDRKKGEAHVYVFDMKPPGPGRQFELWWFTPGKAAPIGAAMFNVDAKGNGSTIVKVPPELTEIAVAAITDEPAGPLLPAPTGPIHLKGEVR